MKKIIFLILILISLTSCEELESFNYIQVTITGNVHVVKLENNTLYMDKPVSGEPVDMALIKAGGERFQEIGTTGTGGRTSISTVFNLYKEQPIEFVAKLVNHPEQIETDKLTWEEAEKIAGSEINGKLRKLNYSLSVLFGVP